MQHTEILDKTLWTKYREPWYPTYQCVWFCKIYNKLRWWIEIGRFGGVGALTWWENTNNTFPKDIWDKIENTPSGVPKQWDVIFFRNMWIEVVKDKKWKTKKIVHWHVAIVDEADANSITVIEQNWWHGSWSWEWEDAIRRHTYPYTNVLWRMHYKASLTDIQNVSATDLLLIKQLVDNWIYNGQEWDWLSHRTILAMAKMYNSLLQLIKNK